MVEKPISMFLGIWIQHRCDSGMSNLKRGSFTGSSTIVVLQVILNLPVMLDKASGCAPLCEHSLLCLLCLLWLLRLLCLLFALATPNGRALRPTFLSSPRTFQPSKAPFRNATRPAPHVPNPTAAKCDRSSGPRDIIPDFLSARLREGTGQCSRSASTDTTFAAQS